MDDYINRQVAIEALGDAPYVSDTWTDEYAIGEYNQYKQDKAAIESVPSADVEPVRHAKPDICDHRDGSFSFVCSGCKADIDPKDNYCRKCGAILDGEQDG